MSVLSGYLTFLVAKRYDCTYCIEDPMSVCKSTILCRGLWEAVVLNANTLRTQALPSHQLCGQKSHSSCIIHRAFLLGGVPLIPFSGFLGSSLETLPGVCLDAWTPHLHPVHTWLHLFPVTSSIAHISLQLSFPLARLLLTLKKAHFYTDVHCTWGRCMCRGPGMSRDPVQI